MKIALKLLGVLVALAFVLALGGLAYLAYPKVGPAPRDPGGPGATTAPLKSGTLAFIDLTN